MKPNRIVLFIGAFLAPFLLIAEDQPNILLIIADDQGWVDLSCAGMADDVHTPNLDRLAASGTRFTQAYSTSPICNASRAGLITGNHHQRQGIFWYGGPGIHNERYPTIAEVLKSAGYRTGYVGKFHYGSADTGQPDSRSFPLNHGFDTFYGFNGGRKHYLNHQAKLEQAFLQSKKEHNRVGQSLEQGPMWIQDEQVDQEGFSTELFGEKAREFMSEESARPFYLQLGFNAVHNFTHQLPDSVLKKKGLKGYHDWDPATEEYRDWYVNGRYPFFNDEGRELYLAQLELLDDEIGKILDFLEVTGLRENTIVVYLSDNGGSTPIYANNGPLRGSKYTLYEGGIRIPLILSWPEKWVSGKVSDNLVSAMDLFPTFAEVAGAEIDQTDGIVLSELLRGKDDSIGHDYLVWDTGHETALREGDWKLKTATEESARPAKYEMVEIVQGEFLYNLKLDVSEKLDLKTEYPEVFQRLKSLHQKWRAEIER